MKQSTLLLTSGAAVLTAGAAVIATSCSSAQAMPEKPNVIYILVDDLGWADLSCFGQTKFSTPNIDAMAEGGIQFMQHYAGCTVSAPSRCSIMTGKHTGNTYVRGNKGFRSQADNRTYDTPLPAEEVTLGEIFKEKGYTTACVGKWGMGAPDNEGHPNEQGFDYFFGYLGQGHAHSYYPKFLHENKTEVKLDGKTQYSHQLVEDKALNFIKENKDNPFFIYLTFTLPHAELVMPEADMEKFVGQFPEKKFNRNGGSYGDQENPHAAFAGMVERLDLSVGRVNSLLKELGLDENTMVLFASDNGAHAEGGADPEFFNSTGVYRGIKRDLYEGGIRTPFIAYMPNTIPAGVKNNEMSAFWDMMPTFAELIGVDCPAESDGISILPTLLGKKQTEFHDYLYWEFHEQGGKQAVRKGDWKLIKLQAKVPAKTYFELYNIVADPSEKNNVVDANPAIVEELKAIMASARTESELFKM